MTQEHSYVNLVAVWNNIPGEPAVETSALVKQFGDFVAVDHIDLRVNRGSFFGFLGPNGAGKSTTIKMLTGLLAPTSGTLRVLNFDVAKQPIHFGRRQPDGEQAVLAAIAVENVGEAGRDHATEPEILQCPHRVLARRAASEIVAREQDARATVARLIEHEVGPQRASRNVLVGFTAASVRRMPSDSSWNTPTVSPDCSRS